jgi:hypothetical protein
MKQAQAWAAGQRSAWQAAHKRPMLQMLLSAKYRLRHSQFSHAHCACRTRKTVLRQREQEITVG